MSEYFDNGDIGEAIAQDDALRGQAAIIAELQASRKVAPLPYNPNATEFTVPRTAGASSFSISLSGVNCPTKTLIFKALNAAFYITFFTNDFTETRENNFICAKHLWDFLQTININEKNRTKILKEFETWRVKEHDVKPQGTGLKHLKLYIADALGFSEFFLTLKQREKDYLWGLSKTKLAPDDPVDPINLNHWLSQHTWLRRDDVGIGHDLYTRLSSPKALMTSFRVTVETTLLHFQASKDALLDFFKETQVTSEDLPQIVSVSNKTNETEKQAQTKVIKSQAASSFNMLMKKLSSLPNVPIALVDALEMFVFTTSTSKLRDGNLKAFLSGQEVTCYSGTHCRFTKNVDTGFFDVNFVRQLALYAHKPINDRRALPVCEAEQRLFSWLMAYQTVQASDIPKLTLSDFRFVSRNNGRVTHIESDYFKGRSGVFHQVKTLSMKEDVGKAVLRYIQDASGSFGIKDKPLTSAFKTSRFGPRSPIGRLVSLCHDTALNKKLAKNYQTNNATSVFLDAMRALVTHGVNQKGKAEQQRSDCETLVKEGFFGLSQIKTSAVYAQSDFYDPTTLINYNSHADDTEKKSYGTLHNPDWANSCGRATRAVMWDIEVNIMRASQTDKRLFRSEFTLAIESVKQRVADILLRMKIITQKDQGRVDELGFTDKNRFVEGDLPDTLYLEDSPETVMKLHHYVGEFEKKHKLLLSCSPEYLFNTALPTAEWIAILLDDKTKFTKQSREKGFAMHEEFKSILPPHFTAQIA
jgi:hypothetical protein